MLAIEDTAFETTITEKDVEGAADDIATASKAEKPRWADFSEDGCDLVDMLGNLTSPSQSDSEHPVVFKKKTPEIPTLPGPFGMIPNRPAPFGNITNCVFSHRNRNYR